MGNEPVEVQIGEIMNQQELRKIYIVRHGWHTGIVLKGKDIISSSCFPESVYYEIGWGDSDYYQAEKATIILALKAIFLSRGSALHVLKFDGEPEAYFEGIEFRKISIELTKYNKLIKFINLSFDRNKKGEAFDRNKKGEAINIKDSGNSQFYQAIGKYSIFNTCNKWTAQALSSTGFKINPFFKLTSSSIISYLDKELAA